MPTYRYKCDICDASHYKRNPVGTDEDQCPYCRGRSERQFEPGTIVMPHHEWTKFTSREVFEPRNPEPKRVWSAGFSKE